MRDFHSEQNPQPFGAGRTNFKKEKTMQQMTEEERILSEELSKSQQEKGKEFKEILKNNPDKRLYRQRLIIQWGEIIDVKKEELRYEENAEDVKYNKELLMSRSKSIGLEALKFAKQIHDIETFSLEEFRYEGSYSCGAENSCCNVHAVDLNNAPQGLKKALANVLGAIVNSVDDEAEEPEEKTHDDIINEEIEQEHAKAALSSAN